MKICATCKSESIEIDKITSEAVIDKKSIEWKIKRGEYTIAPNDMVPYLIGIRPKLPKNWDTSFELNLGKQYANRWVYYWATNQASSYKIKNAPDAYGTQYTNSGIEKTNNQGKIIFKLECPQPYYIDDKTYYPHIHFMISNEKNEHWELTVRTVTIICKLNQQKIENAINNKSYLILNALQMNKKIPNSINLFYKDAQKMSNEQLDNFIKNNINLLNEDIQTLVRNNELSIKDIPIIVYCDSKDCQELKILAKRLLDAGYHKILQYDKEYNATNISTPSSYNWMILLFIAIIFIIIIILFYNNISLKKVKIPRRR